MKTVRMLLVGLAVGLGSLGLVGCKNGDAEKAAAPAAVEKPAEAAKPAAAPAAQQKPKDHPAH